MRTYKQRPDKRKTSFSIFTGFALILILSISLATVYAYEDSGIYGESPSDPVIDNTDTGDGDITKDTDITKDADIQIDLNITGDTDFLGKTDITTDTNQGDSALGNIDYYNYFIDDNLKNMNQPSKSSDPQLIIKLKNNKETLTEKQKKIIVSNVISDILNKIENDVSYSQKKENLQKVDQKTTTVDSIDSNAFLNILNFYDYNSRETHDDLHDYVNHDIVLLISSNSQGNSLENFNNYIKKVANINFNKYDNDEDILILEEYQSCSYQSFTILFFIKTFMDYHNHGKEHLNSF